MKKCHTYIVNRRLYWATYLVETISLVCAAGMMVVPIYNFWFGDVWYIYLLGAVLLVWGIYWNHRIFTGTLPSLYESREKLKVFLHLYRTDEEFRQIILDEYNE